MPTPPLLSPSPEPHPGGTSLLGSITVSRMGFGAMQLDRLRGDRRSATALLRRAVELGIDHIDTAQFYGHGLVNDMIAESLVIDDGVTIVTKVGAEPNPDGPGPIRPAQRPAQLRASVEDNLRSLRLEQIPVVNLRRMDKGPRVALAGDQVVDVEDQLAEMIAMRDEGLIGAIGLSSISQETLLHAIPAGIVCVQNAYNLVARGDEEMLRRSDAEGIAWVPYFPLGSASSRMPKVADAPAVRDAAATLGVTPAQIGLAWLLHHARNVLLIPGTADINHLEANIAASAITLEPEVLSVLDAVATIAPGPLG